MDRIGQELRFAARRLTRSPGFTLTAVATLALAIGANAAIFAVVQHVVLNPLPYPASDRLIEVDHGSVGLRVAAGLGTTPGLYFHYLERSRTLDGAALYRALDRTISGDGEPERIRIARATPSLATVLRVSAAVGRWFTEKEGTPGAAPAAVLSHNLWARRYNSDAGIIGRHISLDGVATEVVGVMPASFAFPEPTVEAWTAEPLARSDGFRLVDLQRRGAAARRRHARRGARRDESPDCRRAGCVSGRPGSPRQRRDEIDVHRPNAEGCNGRRRRARPVDSPRRGRRRPPRGLRQRREPVSGPIRGAPARGGRAPRAGRHPPRDRSLLPHRERALVNRRWRAGSWHRRWRGAAGAGLRPRHAAAPARTSSRTRSPSRLPLASACSPRWRAARSRCGGSCRSSSRCTRTAAATRRAADVIASATC